MEWIISNKNWLFSGAGISVLSLIFWLLRHQIHNIFNLQSVSKIESKNGSVKILQQNNGNNNHNKQFTNDIRSNKDVDIVQNA